MKSLLNIDIKREGECIRMKKLWLIVLVSFLIPCAASANKAESKYKPDWQYVLTQAEIAYYVDMNSPSVANQVLTFWLRSEQSRKNEVLFSQMLFDAKAKKIRCQEWYVYDSLHKRVVSTNKAASPWKAVEANSPMIHILAYITQKHPLFHKEAS